MKFLTHSIRQKLFGIVLLATLVALIVSLSAIVTYDLGLYRQDLTADMTTQAELLGHMTAPALNFDDPQLAAENLNLLRIRSKVRAAAIYNAQGKLFASYLSPGETADFPNLPDTDSIRTEGNRIFVFRRIVNDDVILGTVYLRADYELTERLLAYFAAAAIVTVVAMLIVFLIMAQLGRIITRPILAIAGIAREVVDQRDYSRRAEKISNDEVGALVESFNDMLSEIERRTRELETSNREIAREAEERNRAQQEVMRLNSELETRVHERTAQLEAANRELIAATAAADHANQAKSAFLSSMSHELRTPLNAILGFAQILASDSFASTPEQQREFTDEILKAGRHLLTLINEILDLAKIESGTVTLSMEPVHVDDILGECQAMIEPLGNKRNIRMVFPQASDLHVMADRTRLKQILLNLLSNSIKYNRELGTVVIGCVQTSPDRVRISVQDTGHGLRPEQLSALFQPFSRLGQETGPEEGTGIGLVVTKRLVELMGGEIGVSSTIGIGSVFWVELNFVPSSAHPVITPGAATHAATDVVTDGAKSLLLYVEDNPANLRLVEEIVRFRTDLQLLSAPDGHLGIEMARAHRPQVILLDLNLPGINGMDTLKVLRVTPETCSIPVIAITANAMPRDIEKGLQAGFFRYLTKPIDINEFTESINSALKISITRKSPVSQQ